jgi:hypothetical protein
MTSPEMTHIMTSCRCRLPLTTGSHLSNTSNGTSLFGASSRSGLCSSNKEYSDDRASERRAEA